MADAAAADDTREGLKRLLDGVGEAADRDPARIGALGTVRALREPELQYGLDYLVAVARAIGADRSADAEAGGGTWHPESAEQDG